ncbi:MAG: class I SAM-dependent methyltransferase [Candidatus Taylorbacteria bacterium]|nr:class I SAM-dependent methyltransferase [Candidatus Taylorbacteria bacterium]
MRDTHKKIVKCRVCETPLLHFFSLGGMPLVNSFLKYDDIMNEKRFDLDVGFCSQCYLVQLLENVPPEKLYRHYLYLSSVSSPFVEHCKKTATDLIRRLRLTSDSQVVEIASNDGVLLSCFKQAGIKALGIDPARNIARIANMNGLETLAEFFTHESALKLRSRGIIADLVYGANVLAHVPEIVDFVEGVKVILKPEGTAIFEFPYLAGLFENKFDIIYHEHVFYYSMLALRHLFDRVDLQIYDVEQFPLQGGSLRIYVGHKNVHPINRSVTDLIDEELAQHWNSIESYHKIRNSVESLKKDLLAALDNIKKEGKTIAAYSAPAKGNVLLNYFGIDSRYLDYIVDITPLKQGLYTPGTHLLIEDPEKINHSPPDYLLILCWNHADFVMKNLDAYHKNGGKFIIPIPQVTIL